MTGSELEMLKATVCDFLSKGRMFTGYDVTLETRNRENIHLRHEDVRNEIHQIQELIDAVEFGYDLNSQTIAWKKTQVTMPNGKWAFVYHPSDIDPSGYFAITSDPSDSGGEDSDGTFQTDYRNRLMIKTRFIRSLELSAGDFVTIVTDSNNKTITLIADIGSAPQIGNGILNGTQRVERNGDIRLSGSTLRCAGLTGSKFKVEQKPGYVEISAA